MEGLVASADLLASFLGMASAVHRKGKKILVAADEDCCSVKESLYQNIQSKIWEAKVTLSGIGVLLV